MLNKSQITDASAISVSMLDMGNKARKSASILATASAAQKKSALLNMAAEIDKNREKILAANAVDLKNGREADMQPALLDRLKLDQERISSIITGLKSIANLNDPVGKILAEWERPNGLHISRITTPLGVIGVIYESRPNVTADAGALCLKSGNAVILRGGSDSHYSSRAIHACMAVGIEKAELPKDAVQIVETTDRAAVGEMLRGLDGNIDVIVPRGGKGLVARVQEDARVPVFAHLEGLCHVYVDKSADLKMAIDVVVNSKMRRTGVCGSAETLLIDRAALDSHLKPILDALKQSGCSLRLTPELQSKNAGSTIVTEEDWKTEYLDSIISARLVDGITGAISHIKHYSSNHTDAIIAEDESAVAKFFEQIDSAILLHNASTQFADGGEFGMGAEIGIATGKMHARGPVGVEQLTSFKYLVRGNGQIRP